MSSQSNKEQQEQAPITNTLAKKESDTFGAVMDTLPNAQGLGIITDSVIEPLNAQNHHQFMNQQNTQNNKQPAEIIGGSIFESQPFKHNILDTLESVPASLNMNNILMQPPGPTKNASHLQRDQNGNGHQGENGNDKYGQYNSSLLPNVQPQISNTSNNNQNISNNNVQRPTTIKVKLDMKDMEPEVIRNVPVQYHSDNGQNQILVQPILSHIIWKGKPLKNKSIQYYSVEDEAKVFVGIEGRSIDENTTIDFCELENKNGSYVLSLFATPVVDEPTSVEQRNGHSNGMMNDVKQEDNSAMNKTNGTGAGGAQQDQNQEPIQLTLPDLTTGSQINRAVHTVIPPLVRKRATQAEMKNRISENVKINQQSEESRDSNSMMKNLESVTIPENEPQEQLNQGINGKSSKGQEISQGGHSNSDEEENMEQDEEQSYESLQDDDDDSEAESPKRRKVPAARNVASNKVNKPKNGGVNGLRGDKKSTNANASVTKTSSSTANRQVNAAQSVNSYSVQQNKAYIQPGGINDDNGKKRTKERTITEIIEKVSTWRKLYNGVMIPNKTTGEVQLQRWSLEDAAKKVDVSKKSLDDYLLQLRFGKKFGFNFEANRDSKVGVLRSFVKAQKDKLKKQNGNQKMSSKSPLKDE